MPNTIWLSILIPVYNVKPFLEICLKSISEQLVSGVEVIALDDGSSDGSLAELKRIKNKHCDDLNLCAHDTNRGLSAARNTLLQHARGEYIWFVDSDDFILPGAIEALQRTLQQALQQGKPIDSILFDYIMVAEDAAINTAGYPQNSKYIQTHLVEQNVTQHDSEKLLLGMLVKRRFQAWARITRRELWNNDVRFPEGKFFEDIFCTPAVSKYMRSYIYYGQAMIAYRDRQGSIVRSPDIHKLLDLVTAPKGMLEDWQSINPKLKASTRHAYLRYCSTTYINAIKSLRNTEKNCPATISKIRSPWLDTLGSSLLNVFVSYLKYGDLLSLVRLLRHL